ncbi:hypothetical protein CHS0354_033412 [Potamilus streckersoni]|uniref:C-type lectin domain-containing protein n=1 Tax=Potamilus streckersoni TaxID=2493646 RepID=A0AAE0VKV4_9BIVA|nr:hypothetical protein CHS0354_033412 [Potamilus streckersoni]
MAFFILTGTIKKCQFATEKQRKNTIEECRPSSSCYKFIDAEDIWTSAVQYCELRGWQLVEIEDFDELVFLQGKILGHFGKHADQIIEFWTAGYYNRTFRDWMWYRSHQRIQFISLRNGVKVSMWALPEPNSRNTEDCIGLFNREDYYMNDDDCFIKRFFICEIK